MFIPMSNQTKSTKFLTITIFVLGAALLGFAGGWSWQASGLGHGATEQVVRDYILENPEVLPQAMANLQARETLAQIEPLRGALEMPYPGAILGNPEGTITLVEFTDYACPYCRVSIADVEALTAQNSDLKVVVREHAILSEASVDAARMALAAADQGKYAAFHAAMFAKDRPTSSAIKAAAREAGLDLAKANADIASGKFDPELENSARLAEAVNLGGTPSWIIGSETFSGAVGKDILAAAIARARES